MMLKLNAEKLLNLVEQTINYRLRFVSTNRELDANYFIHS